MITVRGEINRSEFTSGNRMIYGNYGVSCALGNEATASYFGHLLNVEFVGDNEQVCRSGCAVEWRKPVTVTIANDDERVELATVECNTPINLGVPSQAGVVLDGILTAGKWRIVAEKIG